MEGWIVGLSGVASSVDGLFVGNRLGVSDGLSVEGVSVGSDGASVRITVGKLLGKKVTGTVGMAVFSKKAGMTDGKDD